jgi:DNA-binding response OmpR family regulator
VISRSLVRILAGQGYRIDWAGTGAEALERLAPDTALVLLDLGLPDIDGLALCEKLRHSHPHLDILILTARGDEVDVVLGLEAGADDYIVKPFHLAELLARVKARLRRQTGPEDELRAGPLTVDVGARRVWMRGEEVELRNKEFDLLVLLTTEAGRVVERDRIMQEVWDQHWFGSTKTLDIHIGALRRKLDQPSADSCIATIRGVGYRLEWT